MRQSVMVGSVWWSKMAHLMTDREGQTGRSVLLVTYFLQPDPTSPKSSYIINPSRDESID
jgi:hypothetical protein